MENIKKPQFDTERKEIINSMYAPFEFRFTSPKSVKEKANSPLPSHSQIK